ncbi:O-antigen/teichoic acid export membrane protein [Malaciobacter marinus]|uniref:O-antigen/teichoic acid export membrane protein n=1 Tax=Malaciobacter marinus TaxID=505249 RepID=A0AB36ZVC9_9BACT|nr:flippase [Malaciobacter marinus]PPK59393.1 O-antigen/teichoic acid export membrane protein [Malaciobacter marinus]
MIFSKIKSKILQDLLKVLSGNIVAQGIGFLTIIIISRDLGPAQYGVFSLLLAIFTIAIQVSDFGVSISYVKYVSENLSKAREIFITVILSKVVLSLFIIAILYFLSGFLSEFFFGSYKYQKLIETIAIAILFHSFFGVVVSHYQAVQNFKVFAYLNIAQNMLKFFSIVIVAVIFSQEKHLEYFMFSYAFIVMFLLIGVSLKNYKLLRYIKQFNFYYFIQIYKLGLWVFLSSLAVIIYMRLDIAMLEKMGDSVEVGYYSVAMNLAMIFLLLTNTIVVTLLPKMNEYLANNSIKGYITKILSKTKFLLLIFIFFEILSPYLIYIFFGREYEASTILFQILLIAFLPQLIINPISLVFCSINKAYYITILSWLQLPLHFIGNYFLIPLYGSIGAAISTVIINLFGGIYIIYLLYSKQNNWNKK